MRPVMRRYGLMAVVVLGILLVIVGFAAGVTPLGFAGAMIVLFAGALQRSVWSRQSLEQATAGTKRVVTVWRGSDAITTKQYEEAGWTLIESSSISGLGGQIGSRLTFVKD